jgi:hypothetical protein
MNAAIGAGLRAMAGATAAALLLIAATPGLFWLGYGTLDPCAAVATRGPQLYLQHRVVSIEEATAVTLLGPAAFGAVLADAGVTPGQCLDLLWRLETDHP